MRVKVRKGEYETAQPLLQESVSISDRISGENNEDSAAALISLGRAKQFSADIAGAEAVYRQSIAIFRSLPRTTKTDSQQRCSIWETCSSRKEVTTRR
jgi:hypothetical protein